MVARILYLMAFAGLLSASAATAQIDPNLVGWWNFEEEGGTLAIDSSGHDHHGTLMGDPQWAPGYDGLALDLDGQGDYIETGKLPSELPLGAGAPWTVALWAYTRAFNGGGLFEMTGDGNPISLRTQTGDNQWRVTYWRDTTDFSADSRDEWIHFTYVSDDHYGLLYVNGEDRVTRWEYVGVSSDRVLNIGVCADVCFAGLIDDVRLFNRAIHQEEIARIMQADPARAWAPQPGHVSLATLDDVGTLRWSAGTDAVAHDVYLGTDLNVVRAAMPQTEGVYRGHQPVEETSYVPLESPLEPNTTYYWRIDEIDDRGAVARGAVWRFTLVDYLIIDDFESYTDELGSRIYETWIDGWDNGTGAIVGYMSSGSWQLARSGHNSMPFNYDNRIEPWYSEAVRTWAEPEDWTRHGVDTLRLYYHGGPLRDAQEPGGADAAAMDLVQPRFFSAPHINDLEQLYIGLVDDAGNLLIVKHPDRLAVGALAWLRWDIPLDDFRSAGVDVTAITQMIVGAGDRDNPTPAGEGLVYFDDIQLIGSGATPIIDPNLIGWWNFEEDGGAVALDSSGYGHHGTLMGDPRWAPGYDGLALDLDGQGDYIETGKFPSELGIGDDAPRTVALWVYPRSFDGGGLHEMGGEGSREGFMLRTREFDYGWQARYGGIEVNLYEPSLREWVHLAHVYRASEAEVYVNAHYPQGGQLVLRTSDDGSFRIGTGAGAGFDGLIDDVRLYDRAVTRDEVRRIMYGSPLLSWNPQPQDGVLTDIARASVLSWDTGALAVEHDVYLGTDEAEVREATVATEGIYRGRQPGDATSYGVPEAPLQWNGTYYWRVDEIDAEGAVTEGKVWRFQTADYLIIDDFESYDDQKNRIYYTWLDGWDNDTGSTVGYLMEPWWPMTAHSGWQLMPLTYDNTVAPWYSEAWRIWDESQDWTRFGIDTLTLYLVGIPVAFAERDDGTIVMGGARTNSGDTEHGFSFAHRNLRGDGSIVVRVDSVAETGPEAQAGVMIRGSLSATAEHAAVTVTAGQGIAFWYRRAEGGSTKRVIRPGLQAPYWIRLTREGDILAALCSADGVQWVGVADDPADSAVEIALDEDVYIGLVVASDVYRRATSAEFSDISLTGDVTGLWEVGGIGSKYPYVGNDPDPLYIAVADEAGNLAVMTHPDPLVVGAAVWQEWTIPVSEIAAVGVDVTRVRQMTIGVGDRDNPTPSGTGMVHFDDFRLTRPDAAVELNALP